jgi:hypothetical protein
MRQTATANKGPIMIRRTLALLTASAVTAVATPAAAACDPNNPPTCLYTSDLNFPIGELTTQVVDASRNNYRLPLLILYPNGAPGRRPIVIWNHGGGMANAAYNRGRTWGETFAAAGYVVILPSRTTPNPTGYIGECNDNGQTTPEDCLLWLGTYRFGPENTGFLISQLSALQQANPAIQGRLDARKIVIAGHSAGTTMPLANAGAWQKWTQNGPRYNWRHRRPIAFIAAAPQGPEYAGFSSGFQSDSFRTVDGRPFLFISGVGDTNGKPSEARVTGWLRSMAGGKYLSSDTKKEAQHGTMNISLCDTPLRVDHCAWMASLGVAFLDAVVRGRQEAIDWLASDDYKNLTGGDIELLRR